MREDKQKLTQLPVKNTGGQTYFTSTIFTPTDINTNTVSKNDVHVSRLQLYLPLIHFTILRIYSYQLKTCNFAQLLLPPTNEVAGR